MITQLQSAVEFTSHLPRYNEIVRIFFKYGFADVLRLVALQKVLGNQRAELKVHESGLLANPPEVRLRLALEELGPTFIKFGQILTARRDLVNDAYYCELCKLQDSVPTFPGREAKRIFSEEVGISVSKAFSKFEEEAIAGASIAQVHRAVTKEGIVVAVKVQRPNIQPLIEQDLAIILDLANFLDKHVPDLSSLNPKAVVNEFSDTIRKELDFTHEARNAERFAQQFSENVTIKVPTVFSQLSGKKVLTMEFISGTPVNDLKLLLKQSIDPKVLSENISILIYEQIFEHGFFHADPHPGNMTVLPGGVLGLYDYGMMGAFSFSFRSSVAHLLAGLAEKDNRQVMSAMIEMSEGGDVTDPDKMLRDVEEFTDKHLNQPLSQINLSVVLNSLLDLLRSYKLRMKGSFYLGIKALSQVEAIGRELNPELNFVLLGKPYAQKLIQHKYRPAHLFELLKKLAAGSIDFLEVFPGDFQMFWNRLRRGEINIPLQHKIDPHGFEPLRVTLDSIANRLANAILAASVLICSSILILSGLPPKIWNIPVIGVIGLLWGAYMCIRLTLASWKHGGL